MGPPVPGDSPGDHSMDAADAEPDVPGSLRSKLWAAVGQSKAIRSKEMQERQGGDRWVTGGR